MRGMMIGCDAHRVSRVSYGCLRARQGGSPLPPSAHSSRAWTHVPFSRSEMSSLWRSGSSHPTPQDRSTDQLALPAAALPLWIDGVRMGRKSACRATVGFHNEKTLTDFF